MSIRNWGPVRPTTIWAEPDNGGQVVHDAIVAARYSVDIPIWEIGGPRITSALKAAKQKGVAIRIMFNGQLFAGPDKNARRYDQAYQVVDDLNNAPGDGELAFHWASNNFSITHQKTVLIDACRDGAALAPEDLPETARVLVLTLNLCPYAWMASPKGERMPLPWAFWGAEHPNIGFPIRDFGAELTDPKLIAQVARVFVSDFEVAPVNVTNELAGTRNGLVWSDGTTGIPGVSPPGEYPTWPTVYPAYELQKHPEILQGADQGNSMRAHLELIHSAQKTLIIYNEEMGDERLVRAIAARARAGVDVRVLLTGNVHGVPGKQRYAFSNNYNTLAASGVTTRLFPAEGQTMYIHAKVLLADAETPDALAFMGSENIGGNSLAFNRELGLLLQGEKDTQLFIETFNRDWNTQGLIEWKLEDMPAPQISNDGTPVIDMGGFHLTPMKAGPVEARNQASL